MKTKSESEVAQSCPTLSNPMDCSLPGSSIHGIFQARVLEWGAIAFSEQLNNYMQKKVSFIPYAKLKKKNFEWILDVTIKLKTVKLPEENICDFRGP